VAPTGGVGFFAKRGLTQSSDEEGTAPCSRKGVLRKRNISDSKKSGAGVLKKVLFKRKGSEEFFPRRDISSTTTERDLSGVIHVSISTGRKNSLGKKREVGGESRHLLCRERGVRIIVAGIKFFLRKEKKATP